MGDDSIAAERRWFQFRRRAATYQIHEEQTDGVLRLAWENRRAPKDSFVFVFLLLFWIIWAPATLFVTGLIFVGPEPLFFILWSIGGWLGTLGIPYTLLQRRWTEWLIISGESVSHGFIGFLAPRPKTFLLDAIQEITLGYYNEGKADGDHESVVSLNIYTYRARRKWLGPKRRMVAYWLHKAVKAQIYDKILTFVRDQKLPLYCAVYGNRPPTRPSVD